MTTRADVAMRRESLLTAALELLCADRKISEPDGYPAVSAAETAFIRSARRLTEAVDDLAPGDAPKAWRAA
jgi:hypothetical protein